MLRVLLYVLPILLAIYALIDCIQTDESEIRGLPRVGWIVLIVLVGVVGPVTWLLAGRSRTRRPMRPGLPQPGTSEGTRRSERSLAPDDDPEFLGQLGTSNSYDRRLEEWEADFRRRGEDTAHEDGPDEPPAEEGPAGDRPGR